ncbi:MAG: hypothetical protein ACYCYK_09725, partial [Candidatus Dormibacteria bacterium]
LDAGGVSRLAERSRSAAALLITLRRAGLWPPVVPSVVSVESHLGHESSSMVVMVSRKAAPGHFAAVPS